MQGVEEILSEPATYRTFSAGIFTITPCSWLQFLNPRHKYIGLIENSFFSLYNTWLDVEVKYLYHYFAPDPLKIMITNRFDNHVQIQNCLLQQTLLFPRIVLHEVVTKN